MASRIDELEARIAGAGRSPNKRLDVEGREIPDPDPVAIPTGTRRVDNITRRIREVLQGERLRQEALAAGKETFAEADDFEVGDDPPDPHTVYEEIFEPPVVEPERVQKVEVVEKKGVDKKKGKSDNVSRKAKGVSDERDSEDDATRDGGDT